ncbi:hypothetical protein CCUS01_07707 [Colletotrichum cuscutae]|uniref:Uncharacterized protein n=1 Tax=Colletotrichum cuscutae TaxID=1209917 RepID=A0AAI9UV51_9PEZI|nr:hypothetical protein CCUS01_07707 [Colletotrichum cuscutae]
MTARYYLPHTETLPPSLLRGRNRSSSDNTHDSSIPDHMLCPQRVVPSPYGTSS